MKRVRISDVASAAGVSSATVSLVLNDVPSRVSQETRDRVRLAAEAVGYAPDSVARGLRTRRTRTVGLISDLIATTPFAGRMVAGAQDAARENGHLLFLVNTDGDKRIETDSIRALVDQRVDALIYACMWHQVIEPPRTLPEGAVFLDCRPISGGFPSVVPDDRGGGAAAVRELVASGHRRIAYVDVNDPPVASGLRYEGYLDALGEAGIEADPLLRVRGDISARGGRQATAELLDLPEDRRPTALFCFNDRVAIGAYVAARHQGLEIPRDMSIVGYDDQQLVAAELDPPLTTIALPHYEMGRWAMETALGLAEPAETAHPYLMPCPIIRRDSVGPPPASAAGVSRWRASQHNE